MLSYRMASLKGKAIKWSITYFYSIKYMTQNQLPLSTVVWPQKFFANTSKTSDAHIDNEAELQEMEVK